MRSPPSTVLLLIDNAEHLLPQVASHIARLRVSGRLKFLVTSRERLQLQGEHTWSGHRRSTSTMARPC